jgi:adhesin transport system membrane fusion protein
MSRLEGLLVHHPLPTWRLAAWPIMALIATLLIWANFARLDQVAVATAEVVPQGKVKVIQHLEGGIIEHIYVGEGSAVRAGDPLVRLDLATSGVNRKELRARLDSALLHRARLLAESSGAALALPADAAARQPNVADAERQAYAARGMNWHRAWASSKNRSTSASWRSRSWTRSGSRPPTIWRSPGSG